MPADSTQSQIPNMALWTGCRRSIACVEAGFYNPSAYSKRFIIQNNHLTDTINGSI